MPKKAASREVRLLKSKLNGMKVRCYNKNYEHFHRYGGRGIRVCDSWLESFENFYEDMGDRPTPKHSIDRIDNDGNYSSENCRWATQTEQCNNTSVTVMLTMCGVTLSMSQWGRVLEVPQATIALRKRLGWTDEDILTTRIGFGRKREAHALIKKGMQITEYGVTSNRVEWAKVLEVSVDRIETRMARGWSNHAALFSPFKSRVRHERLL